MQMRALGRNGPKVSALGLGCMGISQSYGAPDEAAGRATLDRALALGITFFDTADIYGPYTNERLVGRHLAGVRDRVFLATKGGFVPGAAGAPPRIDGSPAHLRAACAASLERLGVSAIDLYYLHRVDPTTPIEESVRAMAGLVDQGKVRYLGLSEVSPETLRRAMAVHPITAVQSEYSLWTRDPEHGLLATCRELGVGFVPFSPLGRGFLSGRIRSTDGMPAGDFRHGLPRFQGGNLTENLALVDRWAALAARHGCTPAQLALGWLLSRGDDVVPIPGTKRPEYLEENVAALDLRLSAADWEEVGAAVDAAEVAGARYPPASLAAVNR